MALQQNSQFDVVQLCIAKVQDVDFDRGVDLHAIIVNTQNRGVVEHEP